MGHPYHAGGGRFAPPRLRRRAAWGPLFHHGPRAFMIFGHVPRPEGPGRNSGAPIPAGATLASSFLAVQAQRPHRNPAAIRLNGPLAVFPATWDHLRTGPSCCSRRGADFRGAASRAIHDRGHLET